MCQCNLKNKMYLDEAGSLYIFKTVNEINIWYGCSRKTLDLIQALFSFSIIKMSWELTHIEKLSNSKTSAELKVLFNSVLNYYFLNNSRPTSFCTFLI